MQYPSFTCEFLTRLHFSSRALLKAFLPCALVLLLLLVAAPLVLAQEAPKKPDIRLVIDVSGSMKRNDPQDLRRPAVDLLVRLMPDGGKAGVWTFGKYVNMLVPHQQVDESWRERARGKAQEINSVALFTNIGEALEKAAYDAALPADERYVTSIILLTDGMVDISKDRAVNSAEWRRIVEKVLPTLKDANYTIHTVALSDQADSELMERLAVATDGTAAVAHSADDLLKIFLNAFAVAAPAQELPLQNNRFAVDSSIDEFTALVFRKDPEQKTQLIGPDEQVSTAQKVGEGVKWHRAERYDLITVQRPFEGEWQIIADLDPASRITIVSDLSLRVKKLPSNAFRGAEETLSFVLQEEGTTVANAEFLGLLDAKAVIRYGESEEQMQSIWRHSFSDAPPPSDGIYSVAMPPLEKMGIYDLALIVDGKTFTRQFTHRIVVREPFTATLSESADDNTGTQHLLSVFSHSDLIVPSRTQIAATVTKPDKRSLVKPLGLTEHDKWQTLLHADQTGDYRISIQITGVDKNQQPFEHTLEPIVMSHAPDAVFEPRKPEPEPEPEPEAEPKPEPTPAPTIEPVPEALEEPVAGIPTLFLYALLGIGNLVILGGGYFMFRKIMGRHEDALDDEMDPAAAVDTTADEEEAFMAMDDGSGAEEEPPMENLDTIESEDMLGLDTADDQGLYDEGEDDLDDLDDLDEVMKDKSAPLVGDGDILELDELDEGESEDDLRAALVDRTLGDAPAEEKAKFAEEILKAQGLDLAEDELDDAISNLIDELDGSRDTDDDIDEDK